MRKKVKSSEDSALDYEVGLVSGSLSKSGSGPGSGSLSALFSKTVTSSTLFQPAPKIVKSEPKVEPKVEPKDPEVQVHKKKVQVKETPEAETRVQTREQSLQEADDADQTSSAKSRKRKRKSKTQDQDRDQDGPEFWIKHRQKLKERKRTEKERQNRTVFVGNLPLSATKKSVKLIFKDNGPIESIRFRSLVREDPSLSHRAAAIMRKAHPQKQTINAYVVFKDEPSVDGALDRNGLELEPNLFIRVDRVSASHDHKRSVFVGNLPFDLQEATLRRHFTDCGSVEAVRLIRDSKSGLGKGFGYLLFQSPDSVQLALKLDSSKLEGRSIRVRRSVNPEKLKQQQQKSGPGKNVKRRERREGKPASAGSRTGSGPGTRPRTRPGTRPGLFRGEMADPTKKKKKMVKKKQVKGKKAAQRK